MHQRKKIVKTSYSTEDNDDDIRGSISISNNNVLNRSSPRRIKIETIENDGAIDVGDFPRGADNVSNTAIILGSPSPPVSRKRGRKVNANHTAKTIFNTIFGESNQKTMGKIRSQKRKRSLMDEKSFPILIVFLMVSGLVALGIYVIVDQHHTTSTSHTVPTTELVPGSKRQWNNMITASSQFIDDIVRNKRSTRQLFPSSEQDDSDSNAILKPILLKDVSDATAAFNYPDVLSEEDAEEGLYMDFGDVEMRVFEEEGQQRQIYHDFWDDEGHARALDHARDDDMENYYAFDDDYVRNSYFVYDDDAKKDEKRCRRTSWHRLNLRNCNNFHELDLTRIGPRFVGNGAFREVFAIDVKSMNTVETVTFKEIRWDYDLKYDAFEYVRVDALVTERLTSDSSIVDIYGFCALSLLTEFFPYGDVEDTFVGIKERKEDLHPDDKDDVHPQNNLTAHEKLLFALGMAEPLVSLHNFKDGVIVHDDIQLLQYLFTKENNMKLNDFNRAEVMLWDEENQKYCKYRNGRGPADWRAPEEYFDNPLNEKIDIWSLGNNIYSVLTGLYPFYNTEENKEIRHLIRNKKTARIDPRYRERSFEESVLVHVIELCWIFDPDMRATATKIVGILREALVESEKHPDKEQEQNGRLRQQQKVSDAIDEKNKNNSKKKKENKDNNNVMKNKNKNETKNEMNHFK